MQATPAYVPPDPKQVSTNGTSVSGCGDGIGGNSPTSATANLSFTITGTWVPDPNLPSDPAPSSVLVQESSTAYAYQTDGGTQTTTPGSANDGFGDSPDSTGTSSTVTPVFTTQNGTISISHGLSASASASPGAPYWTGGPPGQGQYHPGTCSVGAGVGPYSVRIHPQPYNFHKVVGQGHILPDGTLIFTYDWLSTDGNRNNLTTCYWREYVTYPGAVGTAQNPNKFYPQDPPFDFAPGVSWLNNPFVNPAPPSLGNIMNGPTATDNQNVPPLVVPALYTYGTFTATQVFQYTDTAIGSSYIQIPGPDSGPFSIVRVFRYFDPNNYQYTITKDGQPASALEPLH